MTNINIHSEIESLVRAHLDKVGMGSKCVFWHDDLHAAFSEALSARAMFSDRGETANFLYSNWCCSGPYSDVLRIAEYLFRNPQYSSFFSGVDIRALKRENIEQKQALENELKSVHRKLVEEELRRGTPYYERVLGLTPEGEERTLSRYILNEASANILNCLSWNWMPTETSLPFLSAWTPLREAISKGLVLLWVMQNQVYAVHRKCDC